MTLIEVLKRYAAPAYCGKDTMHDLSHIQRVLRAVAEISPHYHGRFDEEAVVCAAYLHGFIYRDEEGVAGWLHEQAVPPEKVRRIVQAAWESQKDADPQTLEGMILHDAHLVEGGRTFLVVKPMVTGSARGQSLAETVAYIETHVLGQGRCCLPEAQAIYDDMQAYAAEFMAELKHGLSGSL